jgi:hypothetical protein
MAASSSQAPISPVADKNPVFTLSAATIEVNQEPVELDSTPTSHEQLKRRESKAGVLEGLSEKERAVSLGMDHSTDRRKLTMLRVVGTREDYEAAVT